MVSLTVDKISARTRQFDISTVKKLNCWGSELEDVSIIRQMPAVEVLSLSLNKISGLSDFEECKNLQELYLRKNNIKDLLELRYLQNLPHLKSLSLDENPCASIPGYRMIVLRALPNLQILDNIPVTEEEAMTAQQPLGHGGDMYSKVPKEEDVDEPEMVQYYEERTSKEDYRERSTHQQGENSRNHRKYSGAPVARGIVPQLDLEYNKYDRSPRHERDSPRSPMNVNQQRPTEHVHRRSPSSPYKPTAEAEKPTQPVTPRDYDERELRSPRDGLRRKKSKNTNILSAALCLVEELDYNSLDKLQLRARARMDEIFESHQT